MILHALPDITGDGAAHPLSAIQLFGKFVQFVVPDTNSAAVRIGGAEVSSTVGLPLPVGWAGQTLPPVAELVNFYDLSAIYYYAAVGDKLHVLYGG